MSIFELTALLLTLSASFGWLNRRYVHLPHAIGLLAMGLLASLLLLVLGVIFPDEHLQAQLSQTLDQIDFTNVVMNGMLAFLLFAGAINVNLTALRERAWPIATLAVVGTLVSTVVVGFGFWGFSQAIGYPVPIISAFIFGALISPTDPVAVLSMLKNVHVPESLQVEMQGEALFNDGVGVVLFALLVGAAEGNGASLSASGVLQYLLQEAAGGLFLGVATGFLAYRAMLAIDDYPVEVLITLALVTGTYALAQRLGASGPLSVVAAGLLIGDRATRFAMSERTESYVTSLWTLIDEVLNSVLFLLIGLEVVVLHFAADTFILAAVAIPLVLVARLAAVSVPLLAFKWTGRLQLRNVPFLVWAGVRGGISVALALSLPNDAAKPAILAATYAVVVFSLLVQGSTLGLVARVSLPTRPDNPNRLAGFRSGISSAAANAAERVFDNRRVARPNDADRAVRFEYNRAHG